MPQRFIGSETRFSSGLDIRGQIAELRAQVGKSGSEPARAAAEALDRIQQTISQLERRLNSLGEPIIGLDISSPSATLVSSDRVVGGLQIQEVLRRLSGAGLELFFNDRTGTIQAFDRNTGVWLTLGINNSLYVAANGNVGIGTASPTYKLSVYNAGATNTFGQFYNSNGTMLLGVDTSGAGYCLHYGTGNVLYGASNNAAAAFYTNGLERMRISGADGYIGIGTNNPSLPLELIGASAYQMKLGTANDATGGSIYLGADGSYVLIRFDNPNHTRAMTLGLSQPGTAAVNNDLLFGAYNGTSWFERARLTNAGDWGLGTASPACKLDVRGETRLGDGTNYAKFASTGTLTLVGSAKTWDDLRIEPVARSTGANAPSFEKWFDDAGLAIVTAGGTSRGTWLYSFDDAVAGSEKEVMFTMQMPHAWAKTAIHMHVHWVGSHADTAAAPRWGLEYNWKDIGETFGATNTVYSTGTNIIPGGTDADITAGKHYISAFSAITPGSTADDISSILIGRLFRNSSDAADTYDIASNKCGLLYIDAHFEIDTLGSEDEYVK